MTPERAAVAAGDELHASHVARDVLQRHPEVRAQDLPLQRVRLVLVPRRGRAVEGGLVDGVIEAVLDVAPEQPLRERGAALEGQRVGQLRLEVDGLIDLENRARIVLLAAEVVRAPGARELVKAPVEARQQARDGLEIPGGGQARHDQEAEPLKSRDRLVGEDRVRHGIHSGARRDVRCGIHHPADVATRGPNRRAPARRPSPPTRESRTIPTPARRRRRCGWTTLPSEVCRSRGARPIVGPGQSVTALILALRIAIPGGAGPEANATIGASIRHRVLTVCATPVGAGRPHGRSAVVLEASAEGRASARGHAG